MRCRKSQPSLTKSHTPTRDPTLTASLNPPRIRIRANYGAKVISEGAGTVQNGRTS